MPTIEPDLTISLHLDPFAPRAARHHVSLVDRPSPDLRDAVVLLTSELVTRAVEQNDAGSEQAVELRVWMPEDVVRVELHGAGTVFSPDYARPRAGGDFERVLLDNVADRWSLESEEGEACMWFEIDRHRMREELPAGV